MSTKSRTAPSPGSQNGSTGARLARGQRPAPLIPERPAWLGAISSLRGTLYRRGRCAGLPSALDRTSLSDALAAIFGKPVGIVVFGYTHEAMVEKHAGVLLVNPGSPSFVGQQVKLGTVAIPELDGERAEARIVELGKL